jgi:hypothetical protein
MRSCSTTRGSSIVASRRIRLPHCGQARTSMAKTRTLGLSKSPPPETSELGEKGESRATTLRPRKGEGSTRLTGPRNFRAPGAKKRDFFSVADMGLPQA